MSIQWLCDALEARLQSADTARERGRLVAAVMSTVGHDYVIATFGKQSPVTRGDCFATCARNDMYVIVRYAGSPSSARVRGARARAALGV